MEEHKTATIHVPVDRKPEIKLEIVREHGKDADWHNRFVQNAETKEVLYYSVVEPDEAHNDTKITLHRGGKDGPVIATAGPCPEKKYQTDIHMVENKLLVPFHHKHHHHHFDVFNKKYHWKGHKELVEEESGSKVAEYNPSVFEGRRNTIHEDGTLHVPQSEILDLVVLTAIVLQERKEEALPPSQRHELEHEAAGA